MRLNPTGNRSRDLYERYARVIRGERLPLALIDLDAVDRNIETLVAPLSGSKKSRSLENGRGQKTLRIASKSIRSIELLRYIVDRAGPHVRGVMSFSPLEAAFLVEEGFDDLLIAYPTAQLDDARVIANANKGGATVSLAADDVVHLEMAQRAAREVSTTIPIIVDIDVSYRPLGDRFPVGVRRSPLRDPERVADFVESIRRYENLRFEGLLAYEAHIAGVADDRRGNALKSAAMRAMKTFARREVSTLRRRIRDAIQKREITIPLFNGGGSGSIESSRDDESLTEIAAGSGFLDSHLFDGYRGIDLSPAAFFALQVTRIPAPGFVTCHGGGFIASGAAGSDRLPLPYLPDGLALTNLEGAGEVQTPLTVSMGSTLEIGDPVFFRHAKAGELAEHFDRYLFVRGENIEARGRTYRGRGQCFA